MIPNIFSLLGESIVGKHIAKGIIFSNSPKKFHPNGSRIQDIINSEQVERLINFLYTGTFYNKDCKSCIWKNRCSRGCVAESIQRDSIQVSDGDCSLRKIDFAKEIISASQA